jgi:hypothetical protein
MSLSHNIKSRTWNTLVVWNGCVCNEAGQNKLENFYGEVVIAYV